MLPDEATKEFRELYLRFNKVELTDEEVSLKANNLIALYEAVLNGDKTDNKQNEIPREKI